MQTTKHKMLLTKTQWRKEGRGVRSNQTPCNSFPLNGHNIGLYSKDQTKAFKPYKRAATYLVDLFGNYPEKIRYTTIKDDTYEILSENLHGPAYTYLERGFDYNKCKAGIRIRYDHAQSFHVPAKKLIRFVVIDLDNHHPTVESTEAHLELVKLLQDRVPDLMRAIGGKSSFVQYRGVEPTGIQLWIVLRQEQDIDFLHRSTSRFLNSLKSTGIDDRLLASKLAPLSKIEIKPTKGVMVSMVGCYGKKVFTSKELPITDGRFDCIGLYRHIEASGVSNAFFNRYRELVLVRELQNAPASTQALTTQVVAVPSLETDSKFSWSRLKHIAVNGVDSPDKLHDGYLEPLAQALLLREYYLIPDKDQKTFRTLVDWITNKHNGYVSRILSGQMRQIEAQIWSTIKQIHKKTYPKVLAYYQKMRSNDARWPHRIERLEPLMLQPRIYPQSIMTDCKGAVSSTQKKKKPSLSRRIPAISSLPCKVITKIDNYAIETMRKGKKTERWTLFAKRVVAEIGELDNKSISKERMMILAGKDPKESSSFLKQWKNDLAKAGIIQKGWEAKIVRGISCSRYSLTPWARQEINDKAPDKPSKGRRIKKGAAKGANKKRPV